MQNRKLGIAVIGVGGAVGSTMAAGIELIKSGVTGNDGLPLREFTDVGLAEYSSIEIAGWDLFPEDLASAAAEHDVLTHKQFVAAESSLKNIIPWPAAGSRTSLANIDGQNKLSAKGHRDAIAAIAGNIDEFRSRCDSVVVINLASTEKLPGDDSIFATLADLENAIDANSPAVTPAMMYAYAAIDAGVPYGNFTPSIAADIPALIEMAAARNVPIAGKDGKTGQTFIKTVIAPALRARALHVDGWYSTNILGNRDGLALSDAGSLASKIKTKSSVLDEMLGYDVDDHIVDIRYYQPRGDDKEAWDNIDIRGFLGGRMQIKINFLCKDSILAAPLAVEIARCLDLAQRRGEGGVQDQLAVFFKLPMTTGVRPEHSFFIQQQTLAKWLLHNNNED